jgi:hypothetical protein
MIAKLGKSCCLGYLLRMATTGSIRAACLAGTNPAITPTNMQIPMARNIFAVEMKTGKFKAFVNTCVSRNTSVKPIRPPMIQRNEDSNRNSVSII